MSETEINREAVVFVPSFVSNPQARDYDRYLLPALLELPEVELVESEPGSDHEFTRLRITSESGETRLLDIYEAPWAEFQERLSTLEARHRLLRATELLFFWGMSGIWRESRRSLRLRLSVIATAGLLILWYVSLLFLVVSSLSPHTLAAGLAQPLQQPIAVISDGMLWMFVTVALGILPTTITVDLADFARRFLSPQEVGSGNSARRLIRRRLRKVLATVQEDSGYRCVHLVGFSFGAALAADAVAGIPREGPPIRCIALGSSIGLLASADPAFIKSAIIGCLDHPRVEQWIEYYTDRDWYCSPTTLRDSHPKFTLKHLEMPFSLVAAATGRSHYGYFFSDEALRAILNIPGRSQPSTGWATSSPEIGPAGSSAEPASRT